VKTTYRREGAIRFGYTLQQIPIPFEDVAVFMQERWRIAGDRAGSGNTANTGGLRGTLEEFSAGKGVFASESEFLEYWRGDKRTNRERRSSSACHPIPTYRSFAQGDCHKGR